MTVRCPASLAFQAFRRTRELKIVERDIDMSRKTGVHVHFQHVSTAISFDAIRKAKGRRTSDHLRDRAALHRIERRGAA